MSSKQASGAFTILYFASARDYTRKEKESLPAPIKANELFDMLEERYDGFREKVLNSCLLTVNLEYVDVGEDTLIGEGDEVGIIPPVSSG